MNTKSFTFDLLPARTVADLVTDFVADYFTFFCVSFKSVGKSFGVTPLNAA